MASLKQIKTSKENIKKTQKNRCTTPPKEKSSSQPKEKNRVKPGVKGTGEFYHIVVRPKEEFKIFRTQILGEEGHSERVSGIRENGRWATQKWLIKKSDAYIDSKGYLRSKHPKTNEILKRLGTVPRHFVGDLFRAKPRKNVQKKEKT